MGWVFAFLFIICFAVSSLLTFFFFSFIFYFISLLFMFVYVCFYFSFQSLSLSFCLFRFSFPLSSLGFDGSLEFPLSYLLGLPILFRNEVGVHFFYLLFVLLFLLIFFIANFFSLLSFHFRFNLFLRYILFTFIFFHFPIFIPSLLF